MSACTEGVDPARPGARNPEPGFARTGLAAGAWESWAPPALRLSHHLPFARFPSKLWRVRVAEALGTGAVRGFAADGPEASGGNGRLLGPEHPASGCPLPGGDPHRFIEGPGVYQRIRLSWADDGRARPRGMAGRAVEQVREVYARVDGREAHHAYLLERQGRPAGLLQTCRPEHDPLGEDHAVRPGDVGTHLLFAPVGGTSRKGFGGALLTAVLDSVRTGPACLQVVTEPDVRDGKSRRRSARGGFAPGQEVRMEYGTAGPFFVERGTDAAQRSLPCGA